MSTSLAEAIIQLLPHIHAVLATHDPKQPGRRRCHRCEHTVCGECADFWLAASALDLVLRARRTDTKRPASPS